MRRLLPGLIMVGALFLVARGQSSITVGPNVQVNPTTSLRHLEVQIGAHPSDPKQLIACSMIDNLTTMDSEASISTDGGRSWKLSHTIRRSVDPVCGYGREGAAYFGALTGPPDLKLFLDGSTQGEVEKSRSYFTLYQSTNGGRTWQAGEPFWSGDRPWLLSDPTHIPRGRLYLAFQSRVNALDTENNGPLSLDISRSSDGGATWDVPHAYGVVTSADTFYSVQTGIAQLSDGTLV